MIRLMNDEHFCLMGYVADPEMCHRKVVAEKIVEKWNGVEVGDLLVCFFKERGIKND